MPVPAGEPRKLIPKLSQYRDLAHIFATLKRKGYRFRNFFSYHISILQSLPALRNNLRVALSLTHILSPYYRASTHLFTVKAPIFIDPLSAASLNCLPVKYKTAPQSSLSQLLTTVLPPTFLPLHQSPCYRASTHSTTVPRPTFSLANTVLSPTKPSTNPLNFHQRFLGKDVFKKCIKKTSVRLMMFFLFSELVSSRRRNQTHEQC